jgi:hypothetical protein
MNHWPADGAPAVWHPPSIGIISRPKSGPVRPATGCGERAAATATSGPRAKRWAWTIPFRCLFTIPLSVAVEDDAGAGTRLPPLLDSLQSASVLPHSHKLVSLFLSSGGHVHPLSPGPVPGEANLAAAQQIPLCFRRVRTPKNPIYLQISLFIFSFNSAISPYLVRISPVSSHC